MKLMLKRTTLEVEYYFRRYWIQLDELTPHFDS